MDLVGRDNEVGRLVELLDRRSTGGQAVVVAGEPGIGKTRLLGELRRLAGERGVPVAAGTATEPECRLTLSVFQQALAAADPVLLARLRDEPTSRADRLRQYRAVGELLEALAGSRGLVLILDDLHWADAASIELCVHLLRHPPVRRLILALAYRTRPVPVRLAAALASMGPGRVSIFELGPLALEDAATLLADRVDPPTARRLYQLSEGNPGYLAVLAGDPGRYVGPAPLAAWEAAAPQPAGPPDAALAAELTALAPVPLRVAQAAAVVGEVCEPALLVEVAQVAPDAVLAALDELVQRDVLRPGPAAGQFRFRHPLVHQAAYQGGGAGWRLAAHQRAEAALRRRGAPVTAMASQVEHFAVPGDERHVDTLATAASTAVQHSPARAARWLAAALRLLPGDGESAASRGTGSPARDELLVRLMQALGVSGQLSESRRVAHELLERLPGGTRQRADAACFGAMIERLLGRFAEADAVLRAELDRMTDAEDLAGAIISSGLAWGDLLGGGVQPDLRWADQAQRAAGACADPLLRAAASAARGLATLLAWPERDSPCAVEAAAPHLRSASLALDALSDGQLAEQTVTMLALGWGEQFSDRYADARRHLIRTTEVAKTTGQAHVLPLLNLALGSVYGRVGELERAARCFDEALDLALLAGSDELRAMVLSGRCWILTWQGELDAAIAVGNEAVAAAGPTRDRFRAAARFHLAQAKFHAGDVDGCATDLSQGCGGPYLADLEPVSRLRAYAMLAAIEADRSWPDRSRAWITRARRVADAAGTPSCTALADLGTADVLRASDPRGALVLADAAADTFAAIGARVDLGYAHLVAGKILAGTGDQTAARTRFTLAREVLAACGAGGFFRLAAREERRANARRPRRRNVFEASVEAPASCLTDRERHIADLVAVGLTNRAIAEQLHLSPRTVESHLARVFAKLDVRTRSALGHALRAQQPA